MTTRQRYHENLWHKLKIDVSQAIRDDYAWPEFDKGPSSKCYPVPVRQILRDSWLKTMSDLGFPISLCQIFYKKAGHVDSYAHIDLIDGKVNLKSIYGLNWIISGHRGSKMIWYKPNPKHEINQLKTSHGGPTARFPIEELEEIGQKELEPNKMYIVRTGIPHSVEASSFYDRFCISVRVDRYPNDIEWPELIQQLREQGLIEEDQ